MLSVNQRDRSNKKETGLLFYSLHTNVLNKRVLHPTGLAVWRTAVYGWEKIGLLATAKIFSAHSEELHSRFNPYLKSIFSNNSLHFKAEMFENKYILVLEAKAKSLFPRKTNRNRTKFLAWIYFQHFLFFLKFHFCFTNYAKF